MPVQYNFMNLPAVHQSAQAAKRNRFAMERAEVNAERQDQQFDEEQKLKNTYRLYGGLKVVDELFSAGKNDEAFAAADEISKNLIETGIIDPDRWDPSLVTPESTKEGLAKLEAVIAGRKNPIGTEGTSRQRNYEAYSQLSPEGQRQWQDANAAAKPLKTMDINLSDGRQVTVNYDPATGAGYDLDGRPVIVSPLDGGGVRVTGQQGEIGVGQIANQAAQNREALAGGARFGVSQSPAEKEVATTTAQFETKEKLGKEAEVDQALESLYGVLQIRPVLERASDDLSWANSGAMFWTSYIPGTTGNNLRGDIETIVANLGFDKLAKMRELSSSGASGLGQLSNNELRFLQSTLRNFSQTQTYDRLDSNFRDVMKAYDRWADAWAKDIAQNGTRDQFAEYYDMLPPGSLYYHPKTGEKKVKQ